jgi:hypothetical protein
MKPILAIAPLYAWLVLQAHATAPAVETSSAHYQVSYIWQQKEAFSAPYSGPHSLSPKQEDSYSLTATAFLGYRPWHGGEVYVNPEVIQGLPLSGLSGLGGVSNGEVAHSSSAVPALYRARLFLRQSWGLGGEQQVVAGDANQLAGVVDSRRLVLTAGNVSMLDIFDDNAYSHDPRTSFMNVAMVTYGAYDFAADARGYTRGAALEYDDGDWALRVGRFLQPAEPNQQLLGADIFRHYGDQFEVVRGFHLGMQPGRVHLLVWRNKTQMSAYDDALALASQTAATPDLNAVRHATRTKQGTGISLEQAVTDDAGMFLRGMRGDGKTETYAFTEIDSSLTAGAVLKGSAWQRGQDSAGLAFARNGISRAHREYLGAGGLGFFIGDGQLNYQPEYIVEGFYNIQCKKNLWLTPDWQYIRNPAYNADRGSVHIVSLRAHTEF